MWNPMFTFTVFIYYVCMHDAFIQSISMLSSLLCIVIIYLHLFPALNVILKFIQHAAFVWCHPHSLALSFAISFAWHEQESERKRTHEMTQHFDIMIKYCFCLTSFPKSTNHILFGNCNESPFAPNSINNLLQFSNAAYKWICHWASSNFDRNSNETI